MSAFKEPTRPIEVLNVTDGEKLGTVRCVYLDPDSMEIIAIGVETSVSSTVESFLDGSADQDESRLVSVGDPPLRAVPHLSR